MEPNVLDETFFQSPRADWQRQYEALRSIILERRSAVEVARRFGYDTDYIRLLVHRFRHGKLPWTAEDWDPEEAAAKVDPEMIELIGELHRQGLAPEQIAERLVGEGRPISSRTVRRVIRREGHAPLPRKSGARRLHSMLASGEGVLDAGAASRALGPYQTSRAGLLLFGPLLEQLDLEGMARAARWKGAAPPLRLLAAAKLAGLGGAFYGLDEEDGPLLRLVAGLPLELDLAAVVRQIWSMPEEAPRQLALSLIARRRALGLGEAGILGLTAHQMPLLAPPEPEGSKQWNPFGTLPHPRPASVLLLQSLERPYVLLDSWVEPEPDALAQAFAPEHGPWGGGHALLVLGARGFTYEELARLDQAGRRFLIHRRSGGQLLKRLAEVKPWKRCHFQTHFLPSPRDPEVHEEAEELKPFGRPLRQIVYRTAQREPLFLLTNDSELAAESVVELYLIAQKRQRAPLSGLDFFHPRGQRQGWPIPLALDLWLTQVAQVAYELLGRTLAGAVGGERPSQSDVFEFWIRTAGQIVPAAGQTRIRVVRGKVYEQLQQALDRWGAARGRMILEPNEH